jgi:hypothetical protein
MVEARQRIRIVAVPLPAEGLQQFLRVGEAERDEMRGVTCAIVRVGSGEDAGHALARGRQPDFGAAALLQPARETDVVRMRMGQQDPPQRQPFEFRSAENRIPHVGAAGRGVAGVDEAPAPVVSQQPEVDVVEVDRQRHAQPQYAWRHLEEAAGADRAFYEVAQA